MERRVSRIRLLGDTAWLVYLGLADLVIHLAVNGRYGLFRDELYYIVLGQRLDFGFVDVPPFTPLVARVSRLLFGDSLLGLRLLPRAGRGGDGRPGRPHRAQARGRPIGPSLSGGVRHLLGGHPEFRLSAHQQRLRHLVLDAGGLYLGDHPEGRPAEALAGLRTRRRDRPSEQVLDRLLRRRLGDRFPADLGAITAPKRLVLDGHDCRLRRFSAKSSLANSSRLAVHRAQPERRGPQERRFFLPSSSWAVRSGRPCPSSSWSC